MGMYTELQFSADIRYDKHEEIIDVLRYMTGNKNIELDSLTLPDHELFETSRWESMLLGSSYYFPGEAPPLLVEEHNYKRVSLNTLSNLKNYSQEIEKFLNWIRPYVVKDYIPEPENFDEEPRLFVGYTRYEEHVDPKFIYFTKNAVKFAKPAIDS